MVLHTDGKHSIEKEVDVVIPNDVEDLVDYMKLSRGTEEKVSHSRIGLDNGKFFFKVGLNVQDTTLDTQQKPFFGNDFKDTGVKRLALIGNAQNIKENYENVSKMYNACQISRFEGTPHTVTGDQKMLSTLCGKPNSSAKCPCGHCNAETPFDFGEGGQLYTLGDLREQHREYVFAGCPRDRQREFDNVVNWPLLHGPDTMLVLDRFPPPVLHLKLRTVNHICDKLSELTKKKCDMDIVLEFTKENWIVRKNYHGGNYQGNQCNKILANVDLLEAKLPEDLRVFTRCLRAYGFVVEKCHGMVVEEGYQKYLEDFKVNNESSVYFGHYGQWEESTNSIDQSEESINSIDQSEEIINSIDPS